ncbi:GntR family transcriptional regulator [Sphingomonas sp. SUN019]|uniref:GntR family transcriptional regulator n=1 Tax=Sphingomonas sp. SUN019 TaxID=2937788 RepID=UPI0021642496|nr:GntR family transcriptional regulator [Sphingomonas sp. SUN019]UVO50140.1 GntR family transcriptional regulator [Sphingomonas sp. SUN019]
MARGRRAEIGDSSASKGDAMTQGGGTSEAVYVRLKAALVDGAIESHARLDIAKIAHEFEVSPTPVREAAMRLLGEGLLESHPRGGMRPLLISEVHLRALLEVHARLLLLAIDWAPPETIANIQAPQVWDEDGDYDELFDAIARAPGNTEFAAILSRLGERLAAFRLVEQEIFPDVAVEIETMRAAMTSGSAASLRRCLRAYHRRRMAHAAQLAWLAARKHIVASDE